MYTARYGALTVDAAGTLLHLQESVGTTYARIGQTYGVTRSPEAIDRAFSRAMRAPWPGRRFDGDGRPFWRFVVQRATGVSDPEYLEAIYAAFGPGAWTLAPGALKALDMLRRHGIRIAVVSNWDHRLRGLLSVLGVLERIDRAIISGEVMLEKPDNRIFERALQSLGVSARYAVHVGDSRKNDIVGARSAGIEAWQYGQDVVSFHDIASRMLTANGVAL